MPAQTGVWLAAVYALSILRNQGKQAASPNATIEKCFQNVHLQGLPARPARSCRGGPGTPGSRPLPKGAMTQTQQRGPRIHTGRDRHAGRRDYKNNQRQQGHPAKERQARTPRPEPQRPSRRRAVIFITRSTGARGGRLPPSVLARATEATVDTTQSSPSAPGAGRPLVGGQHGHRRSHGGTLHPGGEPATGRPNLHPRRTPQDGGLVPSCPPSTPPLSQEVPQQEDCGCRAWVAAAWAPEKEDFSLGQG